MADYSTTALQRSRLFRGLSPEQIQQVADHLKPRPVKLTNGECIYRRGETAESCWLLLSGNVLVQRPNLRRPFKSIDYKTGDVVGLLGLVAPGAGRPVSLIADGEVELLEIGAEGISELECATRSQIWANISHILIRKLFDCRNQLTSMGA